MGKEYKKILGTKQQYNKMQCNATVMEMMPIVTISNENQVVAIE